MPHLRGTDGEVLSVVIVFSAGRRTVFGMPEMFKQAYFESWGRIINGYAPLVQDGSAVMHIGNVNNQNTSLILQG
jgi:hypothetical protein